MPSSPNGSASATRDRLTGAERRSARIAGIFFVITAILVLFGAYDQVSGPSGILTFPEAVWELSLGIYLIVKGFRPDASLVARDRRDSGADDLAFGLGDSAAPAGAQPAGA